METASGRAAVALNAPAGSLLARLLSEPYRFDFFQAVRILERAQPHRQPIGRNGPPWQEVVRLTANASLVFPPSTLHEIIPPTEALPVYRLVTNFFGLFGPSGVLPRQYTEQIIRVERLSRSAERYALRAWLDLFNHRLLSFFYRAWEKYRFWIGQERGELFLAEPDLFTQGLYALVGLGLPRSRGRLVAFPGLADSAGQLAPAAAPDSPTTVPDLPSAATPWSEAPRINEWGLLYFAGIIAKRPRSAIGLEMLLAGYFCWPVRVVQFVGRRLRLDESNRSRLGTANHQLGRTTVLGQSVWDVQNHFRVQVGPLTHEQFHALLPDRSPCNPGRLFDLVSRLIRFYAGMELDISLQLILRADAVPHAQASRSAGTRLGWNAWLARRRDAPDADEAIFVVP
jgi:type VI secretion system protein ImpH